MDKQKIINDLLVLKNKVDSDDVRYKEIIKRKLIDNEKIIYALNNKELEDSEADPEDYFGINILPYYQITPTQTNVQNFVCYEIQFSEEARYNSIIKYGQIVFYVLSEQKNIIDNGTGIARHDLLAALLMEEFNWSNCFGVQVHCISDKASVVDTKYACRTIVFEGKFPNSIARTNDNITRVINNDGINR